MDYLTAYKTVYRYGRAVLEPCAEEKNNTDDSDR